MISFKKDVQFAFQELTEQVVQQVHRALTHAIDTLEINSFGRGLSLALDSMRSINRINNQ
jgi:hypothetical protein